MKIAIISTHPIQYNAPLFKQMQEQQDMVIHVFYTRATETETRYDKQFGQAFSWDIPLLEGYPYSRIPNRGRTSGFFRAINPGLIAAVKRFKPDAVWVYGWDMYSHMRAMQYFKGRIPVLFRGDSNLLLPQGLLRQKIRTVALKQVYRFVDYALYVGSANKAYFLAHGISGEHLYFAPHAIDNERFMAYDEAREEEALAWRSKLGIPRKAIVALFAGKFIPKKQPDLLIKAVKELNRDDVHVVLAGSGALQEQLQHMADERVHLLPFQNQSAMPLLYRLGDLFVLPSKPSETWGLAINEAMACGRPVLVSNKAGCAQDLAIPGQTGDRFNPYDHEMFYNKLDALLERDKLRILGGNARAFIQDWSYEQIIKALRYCLKDVVGIT